MCEKRGVDVPGQKCTDMAKMLLSIKKMPLCSGSNRRLLILSESFPLFCLHTGAVRIYLQVSAKYVHLHMIDAQSMYRGNDNSSCASCLASGLGRRRIVLSPSHISHLPDAMIDEMLDAV